MFVTDHLTRTFGKDNNLCTPRNCFIMGDFNYTCRNIDWISGVCSSNDEASKFLERINDCFLTQHVRF